MASPRLNHDVPVILLFFCFSYCVLPFLSLSFSACAGFAAPMQITPHLASHLPRCHALLSVILDFWNGSLLVWLSCLFRYISLFHFALSVPSALLLRRPRSRSPQAAYRIFALFNFHLHLHLRCARSIHIFSSLTFPFFITFSAFSPFINHPLWSFWMTRVVPCVEGYVVRWNVHPFL